MDKADMRLAVLGTEPEEKMRKLFFHSKVVLTYCH